MYGVSDLVAFFAGEWELDREIVDAEGVRIGSVTGSASFVVEPGGVLFTERGTLVLGSYEGPASRTLRYRVTGPGCAEVFFDYGDFFHEVDLRGGSWVTEHPCREDLYRGRYQVVDADRFRQEWSVSGPAKEHTLRTAYRRLVQR